MRAAHFKHWLRLGGWNTVIKGPRRQKKMVPRLYEELEEVLMTNLFPTHRIFVREARDVYVYDVEGREYLDFMTVVTSATLGHGIPEVRDAVVETVSRLASGNGYNWYTMELLEAAKAVASLFPPGFGKVHFRVSGSEGVELAVKLAKRHARRSTAIFFTGGYHGRTHYTTTFHGARRLEYGPLPPGMLMVPYPYPYRCPFGPMRPEECAAAAVEVVEHMVNYVAVGDACCIVVEPIQGVGGIVVPPQNFFDGLKRVAREYGILLIVDEVQTGMGRTGTVWAYEQFDLTPDLVVAAKGLAGGLPASVVVARRDVADSQRPGDDHSTFGGSPVLMAAVKATVEYLARNRETLLGNARRMGQYAMKRLWELYDRHPLIGEVRGMGLLIGIELVRDRRTKEPAAKETSSICLDHALRRGLLVVPSGWRSNVIRFAPPLTVRQEHVDRAVDILDEVIGAVEREAGVGR